MQTHLLRIVKSEIARRNAPAVKQIKKLKQNPKSKNRGLIVLLKASKNAFNLLVNLYGIEQNRFILPSSRHKYKELEHELLDSGFPRQLLGKLENDALSLRKRITIYSIIIRHTLRCYHILNKKHASNFYEILLFYFCYKDWLQQEFKNKSSWFIIGDLSSNLIALSAACKSSGQSVLYWQYSFLDFKPLPISADEAFLLNQKGVSLSKISNKSPYYWRSIEIKDKVNLSGIKTQPVGVLLNVHADKSAIIKIKKLQKVVKLPFLIRLHPNSKLNIPKDLYNIKLSGKNQSLEQFSSYIGFGICGNTQAQLKLIMMGRPVIQMAGLDQLEFDFHDYIKNGMVPGIKRPQDFDFNLIYQFYNSQDYKDAIFAHVGPRGRDRIPNIKNFVNHLNYKA